MTQTTAQNGSSFAKATDDKWTQTTLGEVVELIIDNRGRNPKQYFESGIPVIDNVLITGERKIDLTKTRRFIGEETFQNFIRKYGEAGDVLVTLVGNGYGNLAVHPNEKSVIIQNTVGLRMKKTLSDNLFIFYYLSINKKKITDLNRGAAQPSVKVGDLLNIKISLPPLSEQKAIAAVLSSLDDKIELLREENKTLEAIGQTFFKEWFGKYSVDRPEDLPEGWRVGRLGEEFNISIGRTPPRKERQWFSNVPIGKKWISIKDMVNSGIYISNSSEFLTDEAIEKFNIPVIPKGTVILSFKMTVGKLAITTEDMLSNEAIAHLKIKPDSDSNLISEFIYSYLQNLDFNALGSTSSIVTAINSTMIKNLEIIIPDKQTLEKFNQAVKPLFKKIKNNSEQIQTLSKTRDTLLPKLMRGEVRVRF